MVGNFIQAVVRNISHLDAACGGRRHVNRVHANSVAHDDAASLHSGDCARADGCARRQHPVRVLAEVCDLLFGGSLPSRQCASGCFHRAPLLLHVRETVIGDDDLQAFLHWLQ